MDFKAIEKQALLLSPEHRAKLAQSLLISLDSLSQAEIEVTWLDEAQRRAQEIDGGNVSLVSAETVKKKARALLR